MIECAQRGEDGLILPVKDHGNGKLQQYEEAGNMPFHKAAECQYNTRHG